MLVSNWQAGASRGLDTGRLGRWLGRFLLLGNLGGGQARGNGNNLGMLTNVMGAVSRAGLPLLPTSISSLGEALAKELEVGLVDLLNCGAVLLEHVLLRFRKPASSDDVVNHAVERHSFLLVGLKVDSFEADEHVAPLHESLELWHI